MACEVGTRIKRKAGQARGGRGGEGTRRGEGAERRGAGGPASSVNARGTTVPRGRKNVSVSFKIRRKKKNFGNVLISNIKDASLYRLHL